MPKNEPTLSLKGRQPQQVERVNVKFEGDQLSYQERNTFRYRPDKTEAVQFEKIFVPNLPLMGVVAKAIDINLNSISQFTLNQALNWANHPEAFLELPVHRFLWGYDDSIINSAKPILSIQGQLKFEKFGLLVTCVSIETPTSCIAIAVTQFGRINIAKRPVWQLALSPKNGTVDEHFTINTGEHDKKKMNIIEKVDGKDHLSFWGNPECNSLEASDGSIFPPSLLDRQSTLHVFFPNLCRRLPFKYEKDVEDATMNDSWTCIQRLLAILTMLVYVVRGLPMPRSSSSFSQFRIVELLNTSTLNDVQTGALGVHDRTYIPTADGIQLLRYRMPIDVFDDPSHNPDNQCYCEIDSGTCPPRGVINVTACAMGAPALASHPHFLRGDPRLREEITGLNPDPILHDSYVDIHPTLGISLGGKSSLQINIEIKKTAMFSALTYLKQGLILPVAWIDMPVLQWSCRIVHAASFGSTQKSKSHRKWLLRETLDELPEDVRSLVYHGTFSTAAAQLTLTIFCIAALTVSTICLIILLVQRRQRPCVTIKKVVLDTELKNTVSFEILCDLLGDWGDSLEKSVIGDWEGRAPTVPDSHRSN
ncbi:hypothetical protein MSG28_015373 [Choristoneura fumiferana]|uniref:Uncharacterized protein n=1 Tax=Choristoneura fumiferana TaxID=7141 RepID=A0ACC0KAL0_CHOFU|nr:hypothetical protein MSG28_015373 [Choristoneura fumiferana]